MAKEKTLEFIHASQVKCFLTCLMTEGGRLDIVEIVIMNGPLKGCPRMTISDDQGRSIREAIRIGAVCTLLHSTTQMPHLTSHAYHGRILAQDEEPCVREAPRIPRWSILPLEGEISYARRKLAMLGHGKTGNMAGPKQDDMTAALAVYAPPC